LTAGIAVLALLRRQHKRQAAAEDRVTEAKSTA